MKNLFLRDALRAKVRLRNGCAEVVDGGVWAEIALQWWLLSSVRFVSMRVVVASCNGRMKTCNVSEKLAQE